MALSFFTNRGDNETLTLLVDIGSASVGGALVRFEKGKAPHVLATVREDISFQDVLSSARFLVAMNHALDQVSKALQQKIKSGQKKAFTNGHIFCTLSSPWFLLKSRHVQIIREQEFKITERALEEFINEDINHLKEELKETLPPKDVRIIEKKIVQMRLNGYEIKNPYNQKTSRMEISMTVGISSGKVIDSIERRLRNFFHAKTIHFGAFPVAAFSAIRDIFPNERNFLIIDIAKIAVCV